MPATTFLSVNKKPGAATKWWREPANLFLLLGLFSGLALIVLLPPHQIADEWRHFFRAWQLAEGRLIGSGLGGHVPDELHQLTWQTEGFYGLPTRQPVPVEKAAEFLRDMAALRISGKTIYVPFPTVLYAPVPYLGMTAAIWLGELATESPLILMYLGRLGGLLLALVITWQAIRLMPFGRWALFLMAMTPVVAYQRAGMSADSFINAIAMLHLAMVLDLACTPGKKADGSAIFRLGIVTLALCLCKQAYLLLPLFHIVIPQERFASSAGRRLARYWLPLFGWVMAAWWTATVMQKNYQPMLPGCDAMAQLRWILGHPLQYLLVLGRDLFSNGYQYLHELIGTLGWLDLPASRGLVLGHATLLALVILFDHGNRPRLSPFLRSWAAVILVGSLGMVWTLMYLWWAKVGAPSLPGMQGRYFAPFLPLLPAIFVLPAIKRRDPPFATGSDAASFISPRAWSSMMAAYGLALTLESLWRVAGHHYLW